MSKTSGIVWEDMKATAYAKFVNGLIESTVKMLGVVMSFDVGTLLLVSTSSLVGVRFCWKLQKKIAQM